MGDLNELRAQSLFDTKGRVAVVTGGGTGLGLITAQALCANGVKVYITGRRLEKLKDAEMTDSESGGAIIGLQMDCTDKQSIEAGVKEISSKEKFVNFLVNNAGVSSQSSHRSRHIFEFRCLVSLRTCSRLFQI